MTSEGSSKSEKFERLPKCVIPEHYQIRIQPFLDTFSFEGQEQINIKIAQSIKSIKLNCSEIEITDAALIIPDESESRTAGLPVLPVIYDSKWETAEIRLPTTVRPCSAVLDLKFKGTLNDKMRGFYRSIYHDSTGCEQIIATTQFESTFARKAFPCWDEPALKATFQITLCVPEHLVALSNMPEERVQFLENGWKEVTFLPTCKMSTYLVAFIVGNLAFIEGYTNDNIQIRVYAEPSKVNQGQYALEVAQNGLAFYGDYFGIKYQLPKCDLVAIPDFAMGAMENWGLITYREVRLLLDEANSSSSVKEDIANTVAHELAHMWFGNLATMEWWTDLWLNEGFATWLSHHFVSIAYPQFDTWTQFVNLETARAMKLDSLNSSHPVEVTINDPEEVETIFDVVSYSKSASIIRMLHDYLGDETFRRGLQRYLQRFQFRNARTTDFWRCLSEASNQDVGALMSNWTSCVGYPVVKADAEEVALREPLYLEQRRFLDYRTTEGNDTVWQIPISIMFSARKDEVMHILLTTPEMTAGIVGYTKIQYWLKLNYGLTGYYRVQYSEDLLEGLLRAVRNKEMPAVDRFNICNDYFALVRSGDSPAVEYLKLLENYTGETDYTVWADIDQGIDVIWNCLERTPFLSRFKAFCRSLYSRIHMKLGWEPILGESHTDAMLRPLVIHRIAMCDDTEVITEMKSRFRDYFNHNKPIAPDLRGMVFSLACRFGSNDEFERMRTLYLNSDSSEIQRQCLIALGRCTYPDIQSMALGFALSKDCRLQDNYLVFYGLTRTLPGQERTWKFFKENMNNICELFGSQDNGLFIHILKMSIMHHCSNEKLQDVSEFFNSQPVSPALTRPVSQSLENIRLNIRFLCDNANPIGDWLKEKGF